MPPKLRPRWQLPPADHNYAKPLTHLPIYSENCWPLIVTGTKGIFDKEQPVLNTEAEAAKEVMTPECSAEEFVDEVVSVKTTRKRNRSESENANKGNSDEIAPKRKRRKFFKGTTFEPKRRRKKKNGNKATATKVVSEASSQRADLSAVSHVPETIQDPGQDKIVAVGNMATNSDSKSSDIAMENGSTVPDTFSKLEGLPQLYSLSESTEPLRAQPEKMKRICSSCTSQCHWRKKRGTSLPPESESRRQSERLIKLNYKFPFEDLPDVCKLKIFSYLSICDKGTAAQVCVEWSRLMKSPGLWAHMSFSAFNSSVSSLRYKSVKSTKSPPLIFHGHHPWFNSCAEYEDYKGRVLKFLTFVQDIKPKLRSLSFTYDIGEPKDEWLRWISELLHKAQCLDLTYANMDWTWTPQRLTCTDRYCCLFNKMQIKYRTHEKRVRCFNKLQEVLAQVAPKLAHLKVPFDWSPRSVLLMCRLKQVKTLQLGQYMMLKGIQQEMMDALLRNMPQLRELEIQVCSPYHNRTITYSIKHAGLELLDISMCKGFFLHELTCPRLTVLKLGRCAWKGPLVNKETNKLHCIYSLCKKGTPSLAYINRHHVQAYWVEYLYDELNTLLCKVCSCKDHLYRETSPLPVDPSAEDQGPRPPDLVAVQNIAQMQAHLDGAMNIVPRAQNAVDLLQSLDPPLANIVPLFPLVQQPEASCTEAKSECARPGCSKYVVDDAVPSTSSAVTPGCSKQPSVPFSSKGKSCSKFKAKRSKPAPSTTESKETPDSSDTEEQLIPIEHSTVEVRSTPRVNTFSFTGGPTHVAVIPIRVVDPLAVPQSPALSPMPISIQSIALQPQVIAIDKLTGTHVLSGPLTVVKHVIQVVPKASGETPTGAAPTTDAPQDSCAQSPETPTDSLELHPPADALDVPSSETTEATVETVEISPDAAQSVICETASDSLEFDTSSSTSVVVNNCLLDCSDVRRGTPENVATVMSKNAENSG